MNELERLRNGMETIAEILDSGQCDCDPIDGYEDEPSEELHPAEHASYCPVWLSAFAHALLDGREPANPDQWPDAPAFCQDCGGTRGRHKFGCKQLTLEGSEACTE